MLSSDAESPVVSESTVEADLLHALKILTKLVVDGGGEELKKQIEFLKDSSTFIPVQSFRP